MEKVTFISWSQIRSQIRSQISKLKSEMSDLTMTRSQGYLGFASPAGN
jgi:hypothetical protein